MTPEQLAALSACWRCIPDQRAALLYLLAQIAGVTIEQVIAGLACWRCLNDTSAAQLFLLNAIATDTAAAAAAAGQVTCGVGAPSSTPASGCGMYIDTATDAVYIYRSGAWALKV